MSKIVEKINTILEGKERDEVLKLLGGMNNVNKILKAGEISDDDYDKLIDYFMDSGDMPYGVMKARDGDPYEWVYEKIQELFGKKR